MRVVLSELVQGGFEVVVPFDVRDEVPVTAVDLKFTNGLFGLDLIENFV